MAHSNSDGSLSPITRINDLKLDLTNTTSDSTLRVELDNGLSSSDLLILTINGSTGNRVIRATPPPTTLDIKTLLSDYFVGLIGYFPSTSRQGWVEADGTTLLRTDYPKLWAYAQTSGLLVSDTDWLSNPADNMGKFSEGGGSTDFRLPLLDGKVIRTHDPNRVYDTEVRGQGSYQEDAFQGHWHTDDAAIIGYANQEGGSYNWAISGGGNNLMRFDVAITNPVSDGANGTPRTASETKTKNIAYTAYIFHGEI